MFVQFLNCLFSFLTTSLFLLSFMNCLPHKNRYWSYNDRSVRFPEPFSINSDYGGLADDRLDSEADKFVRSPSDGHFAGPGQRLAPSTQPVRRETLSDEIIFPDQLSKVHKKHANDSFASVVNGIPACAKGKSFCERTDNYPTTHIRKLLQKEETKYNAYFGTDVIVTTTPPGIANRIDDRTDKPLCLIKESVIFPQMAENKEGKWLYIANVDNYKQGVRIEECSQPAGSSCDPIASFALGYQASCQQKYLYRKLIALDNSGKSVPDSFRLPACCSCIVKFGFPENGRNLQDRMSNSSTSDKISVKNTSGADP